MALGMGVTCLFTIRMKKKKTLVQSFLDYCKKNNLEYHIVTCGNTKEDKQRSKDLNKFLKNKRKAEKASSTLKFYFK